jgi:hypothetical protein
LRGGAEPESGDGDGGGGGAGDEGSAAMIPFPAGVRVWLAAGHTDMWAFDERAIVRRRTLSRHRQSGRRM